MWVSMIFVWSVCSTFFTPLEFGFFRGLPEHLQDLDCAQSVFLADVVLQFFVAYRDVHTFKLVRDRKSIALIGNMTALIVKGSKTERFRDKMTDLIKYMNRNKLGKEISSQIKNHLLLHYESSDTKYSVVEDIPVAIRSKISQTLFMDIVQEVQLFQGCSDEFLNQIVMKLNEEFFLPGEVILEQGSAADQIYIVSHGILEEAAIGKDGCQKSIAELKPYDVFGDVAVLCNTQQPYTVRVCELCKLLRIEKQSLTSIFQLYFNDSRKVLSNLLKGKGTALRIKHLESDITYLIAKQEAELVLRVNNAAYHGDLYTLKGLINAGADPNKISL